MKKPKIVIYVFGNPLVEEDRLSLKLIKPLKKIFPCIEFREMDTIENIEKLGKELNIIDTVKGIEKVTIIKDIDKIKTQKIYSLHDFDLGFNLKLLLKMKILKKVNIFGIPEKMSEKEALKQLVIFIKNFEKD